METKMTKGLETINVIVAGNIDAIIKEKKMAKHQYIWKCWDCKISGGGLMTREEMLIIRSKTHKSHDFNFGW